MTSVLGTAHDLIRANPVAVFAQGVTVTPVLARHFQQAVLLNYLYLAQSRSAGRISFSVEQLRSLVDPTQSLREVMVKMRTLGAGAFGEVALWQDLTGRQFAVKKMVTSYRVKSTEEFATLIAEASHEFQMGLALDHASINKIYHLFIKVGKRGTIKVYLMKEYVPGQALDNAGPLSEEAMWKALRGMLSSVRHMAQKRVLPDDIHGGNIMLTPYGGFQWVDLGMFGRLHTKWESENRYMFGASMVLQDLAIRLTDMTQLSDEKAVWIRRLLREALSPIRTNEMTHFATPESLDLLIKGLDGVLEQLPNPD